MVQVCSRFCVSFAVGMLAASAVLMAGIGGSQAQTDAASSNSFEGRFRGEPTPPIFTRPETGAVLPSVIPPPEDVSAGAAPATSPAQVMPHQEDASTAAAARPTSILRKLIAPSAEAAAEPPAPRQADIHLPLPEPAPAAEVAVPGEPAPPRQAEIELPLPEAARPAVLPQNERRAVAGAVKRIGSGAAAWYEHPGRTASGETYNPDGLTAAHRTLPLGTRVRVVNQRNGRAVTVRINDRGPAKRRFVIDLSRGAARVLGITGVGSVTLYEAGHGGIPVAAAPRARSRAASARLSSVKAQGKSRLVATTGSVSSRGARDAHSTNEAGGLGWRTPLSPPGPER